jgi:hypothetical protein
MMNRPGILFITLTLMFVMMSCSTSNSKDERLLTDDDGYVLLSEQQIENIVKRSYQYVAMYNVNNKFALAPEGSMSTGGWNKGLKNTQLLDHTVKAIARPNNDVIYQMAMLDLRQNAAVFSFPTMESKYVSLMATGYDHYVNVPLSTSKGDFQKPTTVLFYTERTEDYQGEAIEGVDQIFEMTGDFVSLVLRVMPHANEPEKFERIVEQINSIKGISLAEFNGDSKKLETDIVIPDYGATDADIFGNNLLEVMQFVFNHTTFDLDNELDKAILLAYEALGVVPSKSFDATKVAMIRGDKFRELSLKIKDEELTKMGDPELGKTLLQTLFQTKGNMTLESLLLQSVVGPIGLPLTEATYPPVNTTDGQSINAQNDYVIHMTKEELPPAIAFWSLTLYDTENGFFIPNDRKKYSVGENSGMKLNEEGGLEVYVANEKPVGVPAENWLPINRGDLDMDIILRIYEPDLEKLKNWQAPQAEKVEN